MTAINTVIFDLGGVLVDWNPDYVFKDLFADAEKLQWFYDHVCTPQWNVQQDAGKLLSDATEEKVAEWPQFEHEIRSYYGRWEEMLKGTIDDSVTILRKLREQKTLRLLALTNWSAETFPVALARFDFLQWFEGIVVSGHEGLIKPDPGIYQILIDRYKVDPKNSLFIDDNEANVHAARAIGMLAVHFKNPQQLLVDLTRLDVLPA